MQPRNTLVTVAPIEQAEKKVGDIVLPGTSSQQYRQCEVLDVGPGMATRKDELSTCRDLRRGQLVLVQTHSQRRLSQDAVGLEPIGLEYRTDDGRDVVLVDQSQIVAILKKPAGALCRNRGEALLTGSD